MSKVKVIKKNSNIYTEVNDEVYIKVRLRKKTIGNKIKYFIDFKEIAEQYRKLSWEVLDEDHYYNIKTWYPKEGDHLLGFASRKSYIPIKTDDIFNREIRRKGKKIWDCKDEMDLNKSRYEGPNLKYIKKQKTKSEK